MGDFLRAVLAVGLLASLAGGDAGDTGDTKSCVRRFVDDIKDDLIGEIAGALETVEEELIDAASGKCSKIKKIFGVAYDQYDSKDEPDLELLTLDLRTNDSITTYNISEAATAIPQDLHIDATHKLVIFVHGFTDDPSLSSFGNISDSFLKEGVSFAGEVIQTNSRSFITNVYNKLVGLFTHKQESEESSPGTEPDTPVGSHILALDASMLIKWLYLRSTTYVRFIGEKLGAVLAAIIKHGVNPANIHIIGHSLGAHISGFAGKAVFNLTGLKLGRISGLDPAGPCFSDVEPDHRLKSTDAKFVDVIHTDAGFFGLRAPIGHVDFYPNSGSDQPGCLQQTCSHSRAWMYFAESVTNPAAFPAAECAGWSAFKAGNCSKRISYMGYPTKPSARGVYFLQTGDEAPFGVGPKGLHYADGGASKTVVARVLRALGTLVDHWDQC